MSDDPYYYPGTEVLKNLKNIRDKEQLEKYETGSAQLQTAKADTLTGPFDLDRLKATHKLLFGRVYEWAGQLRENTGMMSKGRPAGYTVTYGSHEHVPNQIAIVFAQLKKENYLQGLEPEQFAKRLAHTYGELDSIHCFRDGNSRALRLFTTALAKEAGHTLDWSRTLYTDADIQKLFHARDLAVIRADSSELSSVVLSCLVTREQERISGKKTQEPTMTEQQTSQQDTQPILANAPNEDRLNEAALEQYAREQRALANEPLTYNDWLEHASGEHFGSAEEERAAMNKYLGIKDDRDELEEAIATGLAEDRHVLNEKSGASILDDREAQQGGGIETNSKEPIAVRLTEEQTKLLLSAEYPNNSQQQTTALYNIYSGNAPVDVMNESVALDYSEDQKSFFATLDKSEKPALDAKLTQLLAERERSKAVPERKKEPLQRQQQRDRDFERD